MLTEKRIKQIKRRVPVFIKEKIITLDKNNKRFMDFYIMNGEQSLRTAGLLLRISNDIQAKNFHRLPEDFDSYLWTINTSYYSMFYFVGALLAKNGIKVNTESSIHSVTFDTFVYYFLEKLEKHFLEEFEKALIESQDLLGKGGIIQKSKEKTMDLLIKYDSERSKRGTFTYEMGNIAKRNKAETSLKRAKEFIEHIRSLL